MACKWKYVDFLYVAFLYAFLHRGLTLVSHLAPVKNFVLGGGGNQCQEAFFTSLSFEIPSNSAAEEKILNKQASEHILHEHHPGFRQK